LVYCQAENRALFDSERADQFRRSDSGSRRTSGAKTSFWEASAVRFSHVTLFATAWCDIGKVAELSTRKGIPVKENAERQLIGALGFVHAIVVFWRSFKTEPGIRASRTRRMSV
jgi:hypothetical protein